MASWRKKKDQKGCQICILRVQENVLRNFVAGKHLVFFNVYGFWAKTIRTLGKRISAKLLRMNSTCPGESIEEFFWEKAFNFLPIPDFEQEMSLPSANVSSRFIKTYFNVSRGMFWVFLRKTVLSSVLHFEEKKN